MPGIIVLIALFSVFNGFSPRMHKVSYLAGGEESSFTLAQRTRSFRPRTSSVISVPLCFKTSTPDRRLSLAGLASRKRERKAAKILNCEKTLCAFAPWLAEKTKTQRHGGHGVLVRAPPL